MSCVISQCPPVTVYPAQRKSSAKSTYICAAASYGIGLHSQFVGEVMDVKVDAAALASDGTADIKKVMPLVFTPDSPAYYCIGTFIARAFSVGEGI